MTEAAALDKIGISVKACRLLELLVDENPRLAEIMRSSRNEVEVLERVQEWRSRQGDHPVGGKLPRVGSVDRGQLHLPEVDLAAL